jgi:glycerol-3-phosphate acyltransferase PlsY
MLAGALSLQPPIPLELTRILAGCAAVVGHIWTVFAGFRGGKGVATLAGMVVALYPVALLVSAVVFAIALLSTGIVSVASLTAAVLFPGVLLALGALGIAPVSPILFWFSIPLVLLIVFTHRANIRRLIQGTENRFPRLALVQRLVRRPGSRDAKTARQRAETAQPPKST